MSKFGHTNSYHNHSPRCVHFKGTRLTENGANPKIQSSNFTSCEGPYTYQTTVASHCVNIFNSSENHI